MSFLGVSGEPDEYGRKSHRLSMSGLLGRRRSLSRSRPSQYSDQENESEPAQTTQALPYDPPTASASGAEIPPMMLGPVDDQGTMSDSDDESTYFGSEVEDVDEWEPIVFDDATMKNTDRNTHLLDDTENLLALNNYEDEDLLDPSADEFQTAPNIVFSRNEIENREHSMLLNAEGLPMSPPGRPPVVYTGPMFGRNHCTITMEYGDYAGCLASSKRPKRYIIASDGSEGSQYAVNWAMGTVLRDGDETLIVAVMETDTKLDHVNERLEDPVRLAVHQKIRRDMAVTLCHQAFMLLQRTQLGVKVSCQAIHANNARHMLLDVMDFYSPTMVISGSRGIDKIRGVLGSMSHYLVQKCSVPVMVCHNKLQLPRLPRGKADVVNNVRLRHMRLDQAVVEKYNRREDADEDEENPQPEAEAQRAERLVRDSERMNRLNRVSLERRNSGAHPVVSSPEHGPDTTLVPQPALTDLSQLRLVDVRRPSLEP